MRETSAFFDTKYEVPLLDQGREHYEYVPRADQHNSGLRKGKKVRA